MKTNKKWILFFCLSLLILYCPIEVFAQSLKGKNSKYIVEYQGKTGRYEHKFSVLDREKEEEQEIVKELYLASDIREIEIIYKKLMVRGNRNGQVFILKLPELNILDEFYVSEEIFSSENRYLIFDKFKPRMNSNIFDMLLLYDLNLSPSENRIDSNYSWEKGISRGKMDVGFPLFPESVLKKLSYEPTKKMVIGNKKLAPNEKKVFFTAANPEEESYSLVLYNLEGYDFKNDYPRNLKNRLYKEKLHLRELKSKKGDRGYLRIVNIDFLNFGRVDLKLSETFYEDTKQRLYFYSFTNAFLKWNKMYLLIYCFVFGGVLLIRSLWVAFSKRKFHWFKEFSYGILAILVTMMFLNWELLILIPSWNGPWL